jgi:hypothetical protein
MAAQAQGDLRGLKILVVGMGVLIVLGTALVIGVVVHRMTAPHAPTAQMAVPVESAPAAASAALAKGEHISAIAAAGPDLAIWVNGPAGDRVLVLDPETGQVTQALGPAR